MQTTEKPEPRQKPAEPRFVRKTAAPPAAPSDTGSFAFAMFGTLVAGLILVVAIVFAASSGDSSADRSAPVSTPATAAARAKPAAAARIAITLEEFAVDPAPTIGRAGRVTFRVHNAGAIRHEFVVLRTRKPAADLLKGKEAGEAGNVGEISGLAPGATKTLRLALKPGHYALICNLPGHYAAGQRTDFTVR